MSYGLPELEDTIALLKCTPAVLNALLRELPEMWTRGDEGKDTFSAFDVVSHLIHTEREVWLPRVKMVLQFGETRTFERFDRWGNVRENREKSLAELLDTFAELRCESLVQLRGLNFRPEDFGLRGSHATLGPVTLTQLLSAWAVHDLTHLHQISRVMAHQYLVLVGPWGRFLGVLHCDAHGAAS
jgi:hypothetical protein